VRITDVVGDLVAARNEWHRLVANPRFIRRNLEVTWKDYVPMRLGNVVSRQDFAMLVEDGQYSLQLAEDGSLLQFFYEFHSDGHLVAANIAFYGAPAEERNEFADLDVDDQSRNDGDAASALTTAGAGDDGDDEGDLTAAGADGRGIFPGCRWLRIDYDPIARASVIHGLCHMHVSGLPDARFLVRGVPGPAQFIEWIMAIFYPQAYAGHRLDDQGAFTEQARIRRANQVYAAFEHNDHFRFMTHLCVPTPV
jgi:hypothetical protein